MLILLVFSCSPAYIPPSIFPVPPPPTHFPAAPCTHWLLSSYSFVVLPTTAQPISMCRSHSTSWHRVGKNKWGSSPVVLPFFGEGKWKPQLPECWQSGATQGLSFKAAVECSVHWWFFYYYCSLPPHGAPSTELCHHAPLGSTSHPGRRCRTFKGPASTAPWIEQLSKALIPHAAQAPLHLPRSLFWAKALHGNTKASFSAGSNFSLLEQAKGRALGGFLHRNPWRVSPCSALLSQGTLCMGCRGDQNHSETL